MLLLLLLLQISAAALHALMVLHLTSPGEVEPGYVLMHDFRQQQLPRHWLCTWPTASIAPNGFHVLQAMVCSNICHLICTICTGRASKVHMMPGCRGTVASLTLTTVSWMADLEPAAYAQVLP